MIHYYYDWKRAVERGLRGFSIRLALLLDPPRCPWCPPPRADSFATMGRRPPRRESRAMTRPSAPSWPHGQLGLCSSVRAAPPAHVRALDALGRLVELAQAEVSRRLLFMTCRRPSCARGRAASGRRREHSSRYEVGVACGGCAWPPRGRPLRA